MRILNSIVYSEECRNPVRKAIQPQNFSVIPNGDEKLVYLSGYIIRAGTIFGEPPGLRHGVFCENITGNQITGRCKER